MLRYVRTSHTILTVKSLAYNPSTHITSKQSRMNVDASPFILYDVVLTFCVCWSVIEHLFAADIAHGGGVVIMHMRSFVKIKPSQIGDLTMSFIDIGK